jgi:cephalosporin hydroxylase/nucleoside-diphosphate-sugar epimerase
MLLRYGFRVDAVSWTRRGIAENGITWHSLDLHDRNAVEQLVATLQPSHLLHLAWVTAPERYRDAPENLDWLESSLALVKAFGEQGGKRFVGAGTCAEYAVATGPCVEDATPIGPSTLYGQCKATFWMAAQACAQRYGFSAAWGRVFLPYGPGDEPRRLVPSLLAALSAGRAIDVSDGNQVRDFVYATDVADLFVRLLAAPEATGAYNVGTGRGTTVRQIIERVADHFHAHDLVYFGDRPCCRYGEGRARSWLAGPHLDRERTRTIAAEGRSVLSGDASMARRRRFMRIIIDTGEKALIAGDGKRLDLYSKEAFELISDLWLKTSWNQKYSYTFTWLGRPIIQHPEDLVRLQEVIFTLRPDLIIETGVAHGGSLIFYASLFKAMGSQGRVLGVDIEIRPQNRKAIEDYELASYISLVEGDSTEPDVVKRAGEFIRPGDKVMVILDSNHAKDHVAKELRAYAPLVSPGSYIVATDGIMGLVHDTPRGTPEWESDNPTQAATEFAARHPEFILEEPKWRFNESGLNRTITAWPGAWLKRIR